MNEGKKKAESRLTEEERIKRLQYGGEGMRAELAMEEKEMRRSGQQGSSFEQGLTPEEQERRRSMEEGKIPYPGYGEDQKAEMAMWGRDYRVAQEIREDWRGQQRMTSGGQPPMEQMTERGAQPFSRAILGSRFMTREPAQIEQQPSYGGRSEREFSEEELRLRDQTLRRTAPAEDQPVRREATVVAPVGGGYGMRSVEGGQSEMTREEMMRREQRERYPSGTGSYYSESRERPIERAAPEAYFGAGAGREMERREMPREMRPEQYPSGTGSYYSESREYPVRRATPLEPYFGGGTGREMPREMPREEMMGRVAPEVERSMESRDFPAGTGTYYGRGESPRYAEQPVSEFGRQQRTPSGREAVPREEMMRREQYPSGSGSYYSESRERPVQTAAPEAYFGAAGRPMEPRPMPRPAAPSRAHAAVSREEMMKEGEKAYWYPPGSGSYYTETWERPRGDVSPEAYYAREYGPPGQPMPQAQGPMGTVQATGEQAVTKMKQVGQQISEAMPPQVSQIPEKTKASMQKVAAEPSSIAQPGRAEGAASTSGEALGAGLRKLANVIAGFTAGFSRGIKAGQEQKPPEQEKQQQQMQPTSYESQQRQQMQEAPQTNMTEEEKAKKREMRQQ